MNSKTLLNLGFEAHFRTSQTQRMRWTYLYIFAEAQNTTDIEQNITCCIYSHSSNVHLSSYYQAYVARSRGRHRHMREGRLEGLTNSVNIWKFSIWLQKGYNKKKVLFSPFRLTKIKIADGILTLCYFQNWSKPITHLRYRVFKKYSPLLCRVIWSSNAA